MLLRVLVSRRYSAAQGGTRPPLRCGSGWYSAGAKAQLRVLLGLRYGSVQGATRQVLRRGLWCYKASTTTRLRVQYYGAAQGATRLALLARLRVLLGWRYGAAQHVQGGTRPALRHGAAQGAS